MPIDKDFEDEVAKEMKLLAQEKKKAYFQMLYGGTISAEKVHQLLDLTFETGALTNLAFAYHSNTAWLRGGHRDYQEGSLLCYDCAEEIMGPGCGEVNDLRTNCADRPIAMLMCNYCGPGYFNAFGERIAD